MQVLKDYVAKKALKAVIDYLLAQRETLKAAFHEAMVKTDLPIPDSIEAPIDELLSAGFDEVLDRICEAISTMAAK